MKNKIRTSFCVCCMLMCQYSQAQEILSPIEWCMYEENNTEETRVCIFSTTQCEIFNGKQYYLLQKDGSQSFNFRYEQDRIIRYDKNTNKEWTVCDFALHEGDSFLAADNVKWEVDKVSDTIIANPDNVKSKMLKLHREDNNLIQDIWLEKVGSLHTGVLLRSELDDNYTFQQVLWWNNQPEGTFYHSSIHHNTTKADLMNVLCVEEIDWEKPDSLFCYFIDDTLVVSGRLIIKESNSPYLFLSIRGSTVSLTVNNSIGPLCNCFNAFYFKNKFPGFIEGQYAINYNSRNLVDGTYHQMVSKAICGTTIRRGDVNEDGIVDINDVVSVINIMAGSAP